MEKINKMEFYVSCLCGCTLLKIEYDEDIGLDLSYNIPSFYAFQDMPWGRFKRIVKMVWYIIRGKEFYLYDILLENKERIKEFKDFVASIDESKIK